MPKKRFMINFDLDTNKYEKNVGKSSSLAYYQIRRYMESNNFLHRQGSCYITKSPTNIGKVMTQIEVLSRKYTWLSECVKEIDVTTIEKTFSLKNILKSIQKDFPNEDISQYLQQENAEFSKEIEDNFELEI